MRFIKLSADERHRLDTPERRAKYFREELPAREPPGSVKITKGRIAKDGLEAGEAVVFMHGSQILYVARAASGRLDAQPGHTEECPYYFVIELDTLRSLDLKTATMRTYASQVDIALEFRSKGWPKIEDHDDRLWKWLVSDADGRRALESDAPYTPVEADARRRVLAQITVRRGQPEFRRKLLSRFQNRCLVTGCDVVQLLEAAHIDPYRGDHTDLVDNGLLLRADIHTLFDLDLLGIKPNDGLTVELHPGVQQQYGPIVKESLDCPKSDRPSHAALERRYKKFKHRQGHAL